MNFKNSKSVTISEKQKKGNNIQNGPKKNVLNMPRIFNSTDFQ